jgi:hypothetical protein
MWAVWGFYLCDRALTPQPQRRSYIGQVKVMNQPIRHEAEQQPNNPNIRTEQSEHSNIPIISFSGSQIFTYIGWRCSPT